MTNEEMCELVHRGEADITEDCRNNVKEWINKLGREELISLISHPEFCFGAERTDLEDQETQEMRDYAEDILHEDQSYVIEMIRYCTPIVLEIEITEEEDD